MKKLTRFRRIKRTIRRWYRFERGDMFWITVILVSMAIAIVILYTILLFNGEF